MRHPWFDSEITIISELIVLIDQQLSDICDKAVNAKCADELGYYDTAEHAIELGLIACQTIIAIVSGGLEIEKSGALTLGPVHARGLSKVQIINHAANYWKHNNEWSLQRPDERKEAISKAFASVGFPVGIDYPLSGVLTELAKPKPASLREVLAILAAGKVDVLSVHG